MNALHAHRTWALVALALLSASAVWAETVYVTQAGDSGPGSLRAALEAIPSGGNAVISLERLSGERVIAVQRSLVIPACTLRILGANATLDGRLKSALLTATQPATRVTLEDLTFLNGRGGTRGALLFGSRDGGSLRVAGCTFRGNQGGQGGALYVLNGTLHVSRSRFLANRARGGASAEGDGGAVYLRAAKQATFERCEFSGNTAKGAGGAIADQAFGGVHRDAHVQISGCGFTDNTAGGVGGAVALFARSFRVSVSSFFSNVAGIAGGGVFQGDLANGEVTQCTLANNVGRSAGAIAGAALVLTRSTLVGNTPSGVELSVRRLSRLNAPVVRESVLVGNGRFDLLASSSRAWPDSGRSQYNAIGTLRRVSNLDATQLLGLSVADLRLGAPESHEFVQVFPLGAGSPLVDAGDPSSVGAPRYDARGQPFLRVANGGSGALRADLGAYERQRPGITELGPAVIRTRVPQRTSPASSERLVRPRRTARARRSRARPRLTGLSSGDVTQKLSAKQPPPAPPASRRIRTSR